jgi:hypothetical protein
LNAFCGDAPNKSETLFGEELSISIYFRWNISFFLYLARLVESGDVRISPKFVRFLTQNFAEKHFPPPLFPNLGKGGGGKRKQEKGTPVCAGFRCLLFGRAASVFS